MMLVALFTLSMFTSVVEAKGTTGGTTTNKPPVISNQGDSTSITVNENTTATITLSATDPNKDALTWSISKPATIGTASIGKVSGSRGTSQATVTYTPKAGLTGSDSFTVQVADTKGATDSIIIYVTINPIVTKTINYVALGDSIATGTIYSGNKITSYVTYFYQYLQTQNSSAQVNLKNLATDGDRTNELLSKLGLTTYTDAIKSANIITISIGGNNLMQAAKDSSALGGYNFNKIDAAVAEQGVKDFNAQWKPIIEKIKSINSTAQIIVTTVYNPYNEADALHNTVDSYLFRTDMTGINDVINGNSGSGYAIADVFTAFNQYSNNMGAITYFYPDDFWGTLTRNPHPNAAGQNIITELHKTAYIPIN